jgi:uncharacterized protein YbjT (DUF2867 family)
MRIAVTGATGRVGPYIVEALRAQGHDVVEIARSKGVDVITGEGLAEALAGAEVIVDAATGPSPDYEQAKAFFTTSARNILAHAKDARRIVVLSIIGVDRFQGGYNAAKLAQERAYQAGPVPVKILRAAQFHEFVGQLLDWGTQNGVGYMWEMQTQLVSAKVVGEQVAKLVDGDAPEITEVAGPRVESMVEAARLVAAKRGAPATVQGAPAPADAELYENGGALPGPGAVLAGPSFEEWLRAQ